MINVRLLQSTLTTPEKSRQVLQIEQSRHYKQKRFHSYSGFKLQKQKILFESDCGFSCKYVYMYIKSVTFLNPVLTCVFAPGVIGLLKLFRSQMQISESFAPEARRLLCIRKDHRQKIMNYMRCAFGQTVYNLNVFTWNGLKSSARTGPVCLSDSPTTASAPELMIASGLYTVNVPFSLPPTSLPPIPYSAVPKFTHTMLCNL